ncbi:phage tail protein [Kribbella sp. VKM Ac-2568]|uniref:phage tail protein n=1 Tax=Kribbella sp. VKM Ac-2568 TaxID=2512219 RepID=UPI001049BC6E|nr:phage tail protein [Kribbella sp. VKM Ac-2568]TCM35985.1 phage tail-like protein [Kribbella sp. VKM Ac-2568]
MTRPDPYRAFRFRIEIQGLVQGGFRSVGGIERQTTVEPYREGGVNDFEHQLVVKTTFPPLTLQQGLVDTTLWDWHQEVIDGSVTRRDVTIELLDESGREAWRWVCQDAFPAKWTGADLDAVAGTIATESVELVHHGIRRR